MRLGLMGGTFDPIHNGHLKVARTALGHGLDFVALVPVRRPPHKEREDIADPFHRFAMAALATAGEPKLGVSAYEVARDRLSYSIDTVDHFVAAGHEVDLILGSDSLAEIPTWRECRALLDRVRVFVYPRRPMLADQLEEQLPEWIHSRRQAGSIIYLDSSPDDTSSTQVRGLLREGRPISDLVPPAAAEYIMKHRLYSDGPEGITD